MSDLVDRIRAHDFGDTSADGRLLAIAAVLRCAHLLEAMEARVDEAPDDPLLGLGFRDVIETAVNGLVCVLRPEDFGRYLVADLAARKRIARDIGKPDHLQPFLDSNEPFVEGLPSQMPFGQRVDVVAADRPDLFSYAGESGMVKAMYAHLCNFAMHGGAGVLNEYLAHEGDAIRLVAEPVPVVRGPDAVTMAAGFTSKLFAILTEDGAEAAGGAEGS